LVMEGGTNIYCPECSTIRECKVVKNPRITSYDRDGGNYSVFGDEDPKDSEIHYFLRNRECLICCSNFETYELSGETLEYLVSEKTLLDKLRNILKSSKLES
jgi:hypothetical protein